eukprot:4768091-Amphidinium_carterae.1
MDDQDYYDKREREEVERPEQTYWMRREFEGYEHEMDEAYRGTQARDRQLRREEKDSGRFQGTMEDLTQMRDALRDIIITGQRPRLQEAHRRPEPKAAPTRIRHPYHHKALQDMTLQELRAK